jgi:hypothetical protein
MEEIIPIGRGKDNNNDNNNNNNNNNLIVINKGERKKNGIFSHDMLRFKRYRQFNNWK